MRGYFQGTGYNSAGQKSQGTDERCRNCIFVCGDHYNGKCPCEYCDGTVVHPVGVECPSQKFRIKTASGRYYAGHWFQGSPVWTDDRSQGAVLTRAETEDMHRRLTIKRILHLIEEAW